MKRLIAMLLFILMLPTLIFADVDYEFSEAELREYVQVIVEDAYAKKDLEIANLTRQYELDLLEKNMIIDTSNLEIVAQEGEILDLNLQVERSDKIIKWAPAALAVTFVGGLVGGLYLSKGF